MAQFSFSSVVGGNNCSLWTLYKMSYLLLVLTVLFGRFSAEMRPECEMWAKLENRTLPLQDQGHANCTTNKECTGFSCVGIYQGKGLTFGMRVMPCATPPGVEIYGHAPQFNSKNFSHIFTHGSDYAIPGALLNTAMLPENAVIPEVKSLLTGRLEVHLQMNQESHTLTLGLIAKACVNHTCPVRKPVFDHAQIPVPECSNHVEEEKTIKANSVCNINEISSCGQDQICVQASTGRPLGHCQCRQGYSLQDDGTCLSNKEEEELLEKAKMNKKNKNVGEHDPRPIPVATDGSSISKKSNPIFSPNNPAPHKSEGPNGGAIAAGVISVLLVILLASGIAYIVTRTRVVPRLRAHITNTPYEDIIINDRGGQTNLHNNSHRLQHNTPA